jgi:hypothetical protein
MKKLYTALFFIALFLFVLSITYLSFAHAGDYHQDGQGHTILYTITDSSGNPVSGQSPRVGVKRMTDGLWLDFNDNTFKSSDSATTLFQTMTFEQAGGFYYRIVSIDNAVLVSMDVVTVVSNDDAVYSDVQAENITWDNLNNLIKMHR